MSKRHKKTSAAAPARDRSAPSPWTGTLPSRRVDGSSPQVERLPRREAEERGVPGSGTALGEAIRLRAYQKWERAGRPDGDGVAFWLEAEAELISGQAEG
jgi:hypothetical protein